MNTKGFALWRIGVCGTSYDLAEGAAQMCEAIGERLGQHPTAIVVHTGLKRRMGGKTASFAADWHFIEGVRRAGAGPLGLKVETVIADSEAASPALASVAMEGRRPTGEPPEMFLEGNVNRVKARTRDARRFRFVSSLDAMIALGGGHGTRQQLTLAAAIDIPILPVPCFDGAANRFWHDHRDDLIQQFNLDKAATAVWETHPRAHSEISRLADDMVTRLLARLPRRAFIIMPYASEFDTLYDLVIEPAVSVRGDTIHRLDRLNRPGNINLQIESGIKAADYCVVVLDGFRPNVLYEMGYAHALGKPLILILRTGELQKADDVPFDISAFQRIEYLRPDRSTLGKLRAALHHTSGGGI